MYALVLNLALYPVLWTAKGVEPAEGTRPAKYRIRTMKLRGCLSQGLLPTLAGGVYPGTKNPREGIVIRPRGEVFSPTLRGRLSFKAISNRCLLAERD